ncbi:MAG TPA: hypothetical protein V6D10_12930 [Trichocoleus sp.]
MPQKQSIAMRTQSERYASDKQTYLFSIIDRTTPMATLWAIVLATLSSLSI